VKDQGAAFAATAAGGIAQFHAQLGFLEEQLGNKLLPMLNQVLTWVSAHWPQISAIMGGVVTGVGAAVKGMVVAVQAIIPVVAAAVDWVKQNWPQISATFMQVFTTVKSIVSSAVAIITALWNQFGAQILAQLRATWTFVTTYLGGVFKVIQGIFNVFAGILSGDWSRVWQGLQQVFTGIVQQWAAIIRLALNTIVNIMTAAGRLMLAALSVPWNALKALASTVFNGIVGVIRGAVGAAVSAATAVGKGVLHGVDRGLVGLVKMVQGWFQSLWAWIRGAANSAYAFALAIGEAIPRGIMHGIEHAAAGLYHAAGAVVGKVKSILSVFGSTPFEWSRDFVGSGLMKGIAAGIIASQGLATGAADQAKQAIKARLMASDILAAVRVAGQTLGMEHALAIARGVFAGAPSIAQQVKTALAQAATQARADFVSKFDTIAAAALAKFDARFANWKPPSLGALAKMQLQDQIKQMTDALGPAVEKAETALAAAFAKGNAAAISQAQSNLNSALSAAQAQIASQSAQDVAAAQAALAAAQASGDPAAIQAAQAALDTAVAAQTAAVAKGIADQRALVEQNLTFRADAEQRMHDAVLAKQRAGLVAQLADLKANLSKHPALWSTAQAQVLSILASYLGRMKTAGTALANNFAAGIRAGIGAAVAAARAMAAAVDAVIPHSPAKEGPLAYDIFKVGQKWATDFSKGIAAGGMTRTLASAGSMAAIPAAGVAGGGAGSGGGGSDTMQVTVVLDGKVIGESVFRDLNRRGLRNVTLFAT
jgi:hypothetical protein